MAEDLNSKKTPSRSPQVLLIALSVIGIVILYIVWNVGLLKPVTIDQGPLPEMQLIFEKYQGRYDRADEVIRNVEKQLAEGQIICDLTFGRYYDDPNKTEPERTRADLGCVLKSPPPTVAANLIAETMPGGPEVIVGTFEGAPWLTALKVYRAVRAESYQRNRMIDDGLPVIETYEKIDKGFRTRVYFRLKPRGPTDRGSN